jgi:hypothetical protein
MAGIVMTTPYPQAPPLAPTVAVAAPSSVRNAFLIYLATAALSLIGIVLTISSGAWTAALAAAGDGVDSNGVSGTTLVNTAKTVAIVAGVIFLVLFLFFAFKMRAGRNWARIVLTILSAFSIISLFSAASASITVNGQTFSSDGTRITGYISGVLAIIAIVLMYLGTSNAYFAAAKAARRR